MNTHRRILVLVAALLAAGPAVRAAFPDESWVGEFVLPTKPAKDVTFGEVIEGKQVYFSFSGIMPIMVRGDRDGWLRIHDGHREGWALKNDFVLVRDAPAYFHRRVQTNPVDTWALLMRGVGWLRKGEPDNAIQDFNECIRLDPTDTSGYGNRGNAWAAKKEYAKAIRDYNEVLRLDPKSVTAFNQRGLAWFFKKEYDKAIRDYDEAIRLDPTFVKAFNNRGVVWHAKKEYEEAVRDYDEAIRVDPSYPYGYGNRAITRAKLKKYASAVADFNHAMELSPMDWLQRDYALFLASCPDANHRDGRKAVELATRAIEKAGPNVDWEYHAALAAAYAEVGDWEKAVAEQQKALADRFLVGDDRARMAERLVLYQARKPYRDEE